MATERTARPMSSFFKFTDIGQMAAGVVKEYRTGENGPFFVLDKAVLRNGRKDKPTIYASAAIGLSTDMLVKVDADPKKEIGKILLFEFQDTEPTTKGSKRKVFRVLELTGAEFSKLVSSCEDRHNDPYRVEPATPEQDDLNTVEEDDDLPF